MGWADTEVLENLSPQPPSDQPAFTQTGVRQVGSDNHFYLRKIFFEGTEASILQGSCVLCFKPWQGRKKKANKLAFGLAASCSGWPITQLSLAVILQILGYVCVREWQRRLSAPET